MTPPPDVRRRSKLKRALLLGSAGFLFVAKFVLDVVASTLDVELGMVTALQLVVTAGAFTTLYFFIALGWRRDQNVVRKLGFTLVLTLVVGLAGLVLYGVSTAGFEIKNDIALPQGFEAVVFANIYAAVFGTTALLVFLTLRDIILARRRKGTRRNFRILIVVLLAAVAVTVPSRPFEWSTAAAVAYGLALAAILLNSFRLSWIVTLTKREKLITMAFSFVLLGLYAPIYVATVSDTSGVAQALIYYSRQLWTFIALVNLFGAIYFGMTFVSTLFHLPTAEAYDRKSIEVLSLHNLGKLVTRVFDFNELTDMVTRMTLDVCEAESAWLEVRQANDAPGRGREGDDAAPPGFRTVALRNITTDEIDRISGRNDGSIRRMVVESRKPAVIDQVAEDPRTRHVTEVSKTIHSMAIVPLVSHDDVIGVLYATKAIDFGFDREDADVLSAFADQVTLALENSRLIEKSLERERLMREMLLAQEMQRKLLPQHLPAIPGLEIEALSTPAFEVGGDYYDVMMLDDRHLGVIVGDVSGKGVSAALYMAEMKGIFQSLSRLHRSPREFLAAAHAALLGTMDRRTFISLIYAILDVRTGALRVARAGHCPMILLHSEGTRLVKPIGLGVGMGTEEFFTRTIAEDAVTLLPGDVAVFYTDGITEARPEGGEEFGYQRLERVVEASVGKGALDLRDEVVRAVDDHMNHKPPHDDLTLVVMKWNGTQAAAA